MISLVAGLLARRRKKERAARPGAAPGGAPPAAKFTNAAGAVGGLADFILASPLAAACGLRPAAVAAAVDEWRALGERACAGLGLPPPARLAPDQKARVFQYYLPVFFWARAQLDAHRARHAAGGGKQAGSPAAPPPLVLGVSAPQGCGKSTLCESLVLLFEHVGASAASVSTDDFYLTNADQAALAAAHPGNPLLEFRGNFGSHDVPLGAATLAALAACRRAGDAVPLPRYDKSAFSGRGDRADPAGWPVARGPLDVVLLEGWSLGFRPVTDADAAAADPHLVPVNAALRGYEAAWDAAVDAWLVVRVADASAAYEWRLEAERAARAAGRAAMTDDQVREFVGRFMPAYRLYLPGLYARGPTTAAPGRLLVVAVDAARRPCAQQPPPPAL